MQEPLPENELAWSLRHKDSRIDTSVLELDGESVMKDLAGMGVRLPSLVPIVSPCLLTCFRFPS